MELLADIPLSELLWLAGGLLVAGAATGMLAGLFGVIGQLLMTYSYRYAEASTIAPLDYSNMIMAILLGYLFFDEIPSLSVWLGAPLIVGAGLLILWREYSLKKQLSSPSSQS